MRDQLWYQHSKLRVVFWPFVATPASAGKGYYFAAQGQSPEVPAMCEWQGSQVPPSAFRRKERAADSKASASGLQPQPVGDQQPQQPANASTIGIPPASAGTS